MRIGLVGAGEVAARCHVPGIRAVPEVVPDIVVDADAERARRFAERFGFTRWGASHRELLGSVDVAVVALPNALHAPVSCDLLAAGVHVLCEKPMARTVAECQSMIDAAQKGGGLLCIGHNRRFRSHIQLAHRLLRAGAIGQVTRVDAEEGSDEDWPRSSSYFDLVESGGGVLMDLGVHAIDLIRWLVGEFAGVKLTGDGGPTEVESEADLRFTLSNGATGRLQVSWKRRLRQEATFTGTDGSLRLGLWGTGLRIQSKGRKAFQHFHYLDLAVPRRAADASFVEQLHALVSAAAGQGKVLVDGHEGMAAVDVVCRAYGSRAPAAG